MNTFRLTAAIIAVTCLTACVKEQLYNTDHPEHGKITLTTTWDDRGEGITIPAGHTAHIGAHTAALTGDRNTLDHLFEAGTHPIHIYNVADNIHTDMATRTATADYAAGELGWFFTGTHSVVVEKDKHHEITVPMHQQVRQLTLELEITGDAKDRLTSIEASLSGVAGAISIDNGNPVGNAVTVTPAFAKTDGKYTATIRLLGITGNAQTLSLTLHFEGGNPSSYTIISNLTSGLAAFNADKKTPLTLSAQLLETPTGTGFSTVVSDWTAGGTNTGTAD